MAGFTLKDFGGKAPRINPRKLPPNMAQVAENVSLDSGILEPLSGVSNVSITPTSGTIGVSTQTIYKYNSSNWIVDDNDVNFVRSPIAEDPHERIYSTGRASGYPEMTTASIVGNSTFYRLGLPAPTDIATPTLNPSTSAEVNNENPVSRSYIYTLVTAYGEEGPPNNPEVADIIDVYSDQAANGVVINFPALPSGAYNITKRRLYRTDTDGAYRFVADIPTIGQNASAQYSDTKTEIELGEEITTSGFVAPPDDASADHPNGPMKGLISLPNGILAGFAGKTVCFSEAFIPNAFPDDYKLTVKSDVVALAPMTSGVLALTKEKPAIIMGSDPASMSMAEVDSTYSCESKRSVVDMGDVVLYACPDGIAVASEGGIDLATEGLLTKEQWQQYNPSSIHAYNWEGRYVAFYTGSPSGGFIFDPRGGANSFIDIDLYATAGFSDIETDTLYLVTQVNGSYGLRKFTGSSSPTEMVWKSKKFYVPRPVNPAVAKVDCDSYALGVTFKMWADGTLKVNRTITSSDVFRLPSGYKANEFEVEITSQEPVNEFCVYESVEEINA